MKHSTRNPLHRYNIPPKQVIPNKRYEPDIKEYDEFFYKEKEDRINKSTKARQRRKESRNAKEERLFNE